VVRALRFRRATDAADDAWLPLGDVSPVVLSEAARAAAHLLHGGDDPDRAAALFAAPSARRSKAAPRG
jgi:hypothetical protein